ncbi:hypothetical protein BDY19DRAFT_921476 [Irpex rosettiformis]|uniref:Uncharacterized protein n=1 Tax=Irpex rosettiformis TaxID=378272 RepID=A0ACB8UG43_9APHY|nr:hypothetical protein BDY19DRAFT_921476 [Irpex rosettiformis]
MEAMENSSSTHADGPEVKDRNVEDDKRGSSTAKLDGNTSRSSCSEPAHAESPPWAPTRSMIDTQNANSRLAPRLHDRIPGIPETTAACTHKRPRSASSPSPSPTSVTTINIDDNYGEESDDRGVSFRAAVQARKQDIRRGHERGRLRTRTPIRVSKPEFEAYIPYFPPPRARCGSIKGFEGSTSSMSAQLHPPRPYHPSIASYPTVLHPSNFIV